jgi:N-formylglutamate deformylase
VARRLATYWQPYHQQLRVELDRLLALHGRVVLWEAHSIASIVPRFLRWQAAGPELRHRQRREPAIRRWNDIVTGIAQADGRYTVAVNGRFKGGHITRFYGKPQQGVHAIQLEMCQSTYMDETPPFAYRADLAEQVQPLLRRMTQAAADWARG